MKKILLNPGPTNTRAITKISQWLGSDVCHRTEEFQSRLSQLRLQLLNSFGSIDYQIAVMAGSGTTALDSMISSIGENGMLIVDAGKYGSRACDIAKAYNINYGRVFSKTIEDLEGDSSAKLVYFVENETSTGEKYSLKKMSSLYPSAKFIVDATSSFGASFYSSYIDRIAAVSFCSNKCLQSTPGLGIVIWDKRLHLYKRSYYGDLNLYKDGRMPFTLPVQCVEALLSALKHNQNNKRVFDARMKKLIAEFSKIDIPCINEKPCNSIAAFVHPRKSYEELQSFLNDKGIVIYSGVEGIQNSFRVATMSVDFDRKFKKIVGAFGDSCVH